MEKKEIPIDYEYIKNNIDSMITPEMVSFVARYTGKEPLGYMSKEAWIDFIIGAMLFGISVGVTRFYQQKE